MKKLLNKEICFNCSPFFINFCTYAAVFFVILLLYWFVVNNSNNTKIKSSNKPPCVITRDEYGAVDTTCSDEDLRGYSEEDTNSQTDEFDTVRGADF